jgi:hypothetical protein
MSVIMFPTAVSGFVADARRERLDHSCLEFRPRMGGQDRVTLLGREGVERRAEDVVLHAECHEPHLCLLVVRNLPCRVQRDRFPDGHDLLLG